MNYDDIAHLYDLQYELYRDDLHFYGRIAEEVNPTQHSGSILEIGSGTGRVTSYLAKRGFQIVGLEPSQKMIERAKQRCSNAGIEIPFFQGDIRALNIPSHLPQQYDLVIAPFNALMHLYTVADQEQAFNNIHNLLKPEGIFVFDLYIPQFGATNILRHEGETLYDQGKRTDIFLLQRHDTLKQLIITEYFVDTVESTGQLKRDFYTLTQRYFTRYEVEWLLRATGFCATKVQGSFQGGPLRPSSETMIFQTKPQHKRSS